MIRNVVLTGYVYTPGAARKSMKINDFKFFLSLSST